MWVDILWYLKLEARGKSLQIITNVPRYLQSVEYLPARGQNWIWSQNVDTRTQLQPEYKMFKWFSIFIFIQRTTEASWHIL